MKRLIILTIIGVLSCAFFSCEKEEVVDQRPNLTMAKSVAFHATRMNAQSTFDATPLDTLTRYSNNFFDIKEVSDSVISVSCQYKFGGEITKISIPKIPITGKLFDVAFNHESSDGTVWHRNTEYSSVITSVKGWIKERELSDGQSKNSHSTKTSPVIWIYDYQIDITCVLDDKTLHIKTIPKEQKFPSAN